MKAITTKFVGPTNTKGSRVVASDMDGNRVIVSYDHASIDPHKDAAVALCRKMNWDGVLVEGSIKGGSVFVFLSDRDCVNLQDPDLRIGKQVYA